MRSAASTAASATRAARDFELARRPSKLAKLHRHVSNVSLHQHLLSRLPHQPQHSINMPSRGVPQGQDFTTVTFSKKPPGPKPGGAGPAKPGGGGGGSSATSTGMSAAKLDAETDELKHATVSKDLRLAIQKGRTAKGLTQKQLATQLNMQPAVINEYESGKAVPNNAVIAKIEKALGCKLPRAPKK